MGSSSNISSSSKRGMAYAMVLLLLLSGLALCILPPSSAGADSDYDSEVTYHANNGSGQTLIVGYDGIVLSEYNPEYWAGTVDGANGEVNWAGESVESTLKMDIKIQTPQSQKRVNHQYKLSCTNVTPESVISISGDNTSIDNVSIEGNSINFSAKGNTSVTMEIQFSKNVAKVFGGWSETTNGSCDYDPGELIPSDVKELYAVWVDPALYGGYSLSWEGKSADLYCQDSISVQESSDLKAKGSVNNVTPTMYNTIYELKEDIDVSGDIDIVGTIRSDSTTSIRKLTFGQNDIRLGGDTIIDNVEIVATNGANHGDAGGGLYANGHKLILGTGIDSPATKFNDDYSARSYLQVFGGSNADIGGNTFLVIHSGVYGNVFGGSKAAGIGGSSYVYIKGATVLDTLGGGSSGLATTQNKAISGDCYVYATGLVMPGDSYEEKELYDKGALTSKSIPDGVFLDESSILTGGSNSSIVNGNSYVFLSGDSEVWDVQAAGRRATSSVTTAMLTIDGNALVKHVACGSITDGNNGGNTYTDRHCLVDAVLKVGGNARVAAVYGAGFDTFYSPTYVSVFGSDSNITVEITGGTVGNVYGGGYRGTVGTSSDPIDGILIKITGGTVLGDVYGGGRGGVDKICHTEDGAFSWGSAYGDSTGKSIVYGNVTLQLTGGSIAGSVYGGGESVPILDSYTGFSGTSFTGHECVAKVIGDVSITISGCSIGTDVYGSGKGADPSNADNSVMYLLGHTGGITEVDWTSSGKATYKSVSSDYDGYASVEGKISIDVYGSVAGSVYGGGQGVADNNMTTVAKANSNISINILNGATVGKNVYGGGAYGTIECADATKDTIGIIVEGSVIGSVYGGGQGIANSASTSVAAVIGDISVAVGGTVSGNVYGGGAYGTVTGNGSDANAISVAVNGTVAGSVYGGGQGLSGNSNKDIAKVIGDVFVKILGNATVNGDVFGGGAYGQVVGNTAVTVSGTVYGSVYCGGLGTEAVMAVSGSRTLTISGGKIKGSAYGGSRFGDDGVDDGVASSIDESTDFSDDDSLLFLSAGTVEGSIYGGGYKGKMYGNTHIYVGYTDKTTFSQDTVAIYLSIYGGADIGEGDSGAAFSKPLVFGSTSIDIYGAHLSVRGSIFGSGNSCLTTGETTVNITNFRQSGSMESIQRADHVTISNSLITLTGRSDATSSSATTLYSFNRIGDLTIKAGTTIYIYSMLNEIGSYTSATAAGNPTPYQTPLNTIYICEGIVFSVKTTVSDKEVYSPITGYTILNVITTELYYGAFAYGSIASPGGFVMFNNGTYSVASTKDIADVSRCWFIAGTAQYTHTAVLESTDKKYSSDNVLVTIPTTMSGTFIRYVGVNTYPDLAGTLKLTDKEDNITANDYLLSMGDKKGSVVFGTDGICLVPETLSDVGTQSNTPSLSFNITGLSPISSGHVGYVIIHLQEVTPTYNGLGYMLVNSVDIKIDLYTEYDVTITDNQVYDKQIEIVDNKGSVDLTLPLELYRYELYLEGVTSTVPVSLSTVAGNDGFLGWNAPLFQSDDVSGSEHRHIAQINGTYYPTLRFAVDGIMSNTAFELSFSLVSPGGSTTVNFVVKVTVILKDLVTVSFIDSKIDEQPTRLTFPYGHTITEGDCPETMDYFVGWYTSSQFILKYNYNLPLTSDISLYACYMYTVTFQNNNGTTSTALVGMDGDRLVTKPADPIRTGYGFDKWYRDPELKDPWDFTADQISTDTTLYAGWEGADINVSFYYSIEGQANPILLTEEKLQVKFGGTYAGLSQFTDLMKGVMKNKTELANSHFIRWTYTDNGKVICVYDDTIVSVPSAEIVLNAEFAQSALEVRLLNNAGGDNVVIEAPKTFLVFPDGAEFTFMPGNATRTGYKLVGWAYDMDGVEADIPSGDSVTLNLRSSHVKIYENEDKEQCPYVEYYAVWDQIEYTVTIVAPNGGQIAYSVNNGAEHTITSGKVDLTLHYGQTVDLAYSDPSGDYTFSKWFVNGTSVLNSAGSSTELTVNGNCAVYAKLKGLCAVTIYATLDGVPADDKIGFFLDSDKNKTMDEGIGYLSQNESYGIYRSSIKIGIYDIYASDKEGEYSSIIYSKPIVDGTELYVDLYSVTMEIEGYPGVSSDHTVAVSGSSVTITVPKDLTIKDLAVKYLNASNEEVSVDIAADAGKYKFTMPAVAVKVTGSVTKDIGSVEIRNFIEEFTYDGSEHKQDTLELWDGATKLVLGTDYGITYPENVIDAGEVILTIVGKGIYSGNVNGDHASYSIAKAVVDIPQLPISSFVYNAAEQGPGNALFLSPVGYKVVEDGTSYSATAIGIYHIKLQLLDNYKWSDGSTSPISLTWSIDENTVKVSVTNEAALIFTGSVIHPTLRVTVDGEEVGADSYSVSYKMGDESKDPINIGTYTAYVTVGNHYPAWATFKVSAKDISSATVDIEGFEYNGSSQMPQVEDVSVTFGEDRNYSVTFTISGKSATDAGTYSMTLAGTGDYTGEKIVNWTIRPLGLSASDIEIALGNALSYTGKEQTKVISSVTANKGGKVYSLTSNDYEVLDTVVDGVVRGTDKGTDATSYTMKIGLKGNYMLKDGEQLSADWSIEKSAVSIPDSKEYVYNGADQSLSTSEKFYTVKSGTNTAKDVGDYEVTFELKNSNYCWETVGRIISDQTVSWKITKAKLTITPSGTAKYWDAVPAYSLNYSGLLGSDTGASAVSGTPDYTCSYGQGSIPGDYVLTVKGLTSDNYNITFASGVLSVSKAKLADPSGFEWNGANVEWGAVSPITSNGDNVTYSVIVYKDGVKLSEVKPASNPYSLVGMINSDDGGAGSYTVEVRAVSSDLGIIDNSDYVRFESALSVVSKTVSVNKDNEAWADFAGTITLMNGSDSFIASSDYSGPPIGGDDEPLALKSSPPTEYTFAVVDGIDYKIFVNGKDTCHQMLKNIQSKVLDYYTVTITGDDNVTQFKISADKSEIKVWSDYTGPVILLDNECLFVEPVISSGYTLKKWADNKNNESTSLVLEIKEMGDAVETKASSMPITFKVKLDLDGGSLGDQTGWEANSREVGYNTGITAPAVSKTGHTFIGWNTVKDGSGSTIANGGDISKLTTVANAEITLYAKWEINVYTVTLIGSHITSTDLTSPVTYGTNVSFNIDADTGYTIDSLTVKINDVVVDSSKYRWDDSTGVFAYDTIDGNLSVEVSLKNLVNNVTLNCSTHYPTGTLTATVSTGVEVTYQWQYSEDDISWSVLDGETGVNLTIPSDFDGKYLRVVVTGTGDYSGVVESVSIKVVKESQSALTITGMPSSFKNGDSFTLTASGGSTGGTVTWTATDEATVDSDGKVTITGTGSFSITATMAGNDEFKPVTSTVSGTAGNAQQTEFAITGGNPSPSIGDSFILSTTAASGTVIIWSVVSGSSNASVDSNGRVTINGAGSFTIRATSTLTGYDDASAEWSATSEFDEQSELIISGIPASVHIGDTFRLTASGGTTGEPISWEIYQGAGIASITADGTVTVLTEGTFTILATMPGNNTYSDVSAIVLLDATKEMSGTPAAPSVESIARDSVTLTQIDGFEYSMDGVDWQVENVFSDLEMGTEYTFYQRVAETDDLAASASSAGLTVSTKNEYNVTVVAGEHGTVTPTGIVAVESDQTFSLSCVPDEGYAVDYISVGGSIHSGVESIEFVPVDDTEVTVVFIRQFAITAIDDDGFVMTPDGITYVNEGASMTYTITAGEKYTISDVLIDGASVGATGSYTFDNVTADHTISAVTVQSKYSVFVSSGENGSFDREGEFLVDAGESFTVTAVPDTGYAVKGLIVDSTYYEGASYTITNINEDHIVYTTFSGPDTIDVAVSLSANASASGNVSVYVNGIAITSGTISLPVGTHVEVAVIPGVDMRVASLTMNDQDIILSEDESLIGTIIGTGELTEDIVIGVDVENCYSQRTISSGNVYLTGSSVRYNTEFSATPLDPTSVNWGADMDDSDKLAYYLEAYVGGSDEYIAFYGDLQVKIFVGTEYDGMTVGVMHKSSVTGETELFSAMVVDGYVTVTVSDLSPFMVSLPEVENFLYWIFLIIVLMILIICLIARYCKKHHVYSDFTHN